MFDSNIALGFIGQQLAIVFKAIMRSHFVSLAEGLSGARIMLDHLTTYLSSQMNTSVSLMTLYILRFGKSR